MSDDSVEQKNQDENVEEQISTEQLAEAGAEAIESSTQDGAEGEVEQIDIADLAGTQPEKTEAEKEQNNLYAANRVKTKKLRELEKQIESGVIPESHAYKAPEVGDKPKLQDFVNEERLYADFNGSDAVALAAFNEAKEDWAASNGSVETERANHADTVRAKIQADIVSEEAFEKSVESYGKVVKGLDKSIGQAEQLLGDVDFKAVRDLIGENASLVLGAIGGNKAEQDAFMVAVSQSTTSQNPVHLIKHLARLEDKVMSNLPSATQISNAASESPVGDGGGNKDNLDALIEKASLDNPEEYRRLKNIQRGRKTA